jgi:hypothetical protein
MGGHFVQAKTIAIDIMVMDPEQFEWPEQPIARSRAMVFEVFQSWHIHLRLDKVKS